MRLPIKCSSQVGLLTSHIFQNYLFTRISQTSSYTRTTSTVSSYNRSQNLTMPSLSRIEAEAPSISDLETALEVPGASKRSEVRFTISNLPPELRHQIYAEYFHSLPPLLISHDTLSLLKLTTKPDNEPNTNTSTARLLSARILSRNPLALASPFFEADILSSIFLSNLTFEFTCTGVLKSFSSLLSALQKNPQIQSSTQVRSLQISYGPLRRRAPDWVYLVNSCFPELEQVVFVLDITSCENELCELRRGQFDCWWECMRDAIREAIAVREVRNGRNQKGMVVVVQDEAGAEMAWKRFGGGEKMKSIV